MSGNTGPLRQISEERPQRCRRPPPRPRVDDLGHTWGWQASSGKPGLKLRFPLEYQQAMTSKDTSLELRQETVLAEKPVIDQRRVANKDRKADDELRMKIANQCCGNGVERGLLHTRHSRSPHPTDP